MLQNALWLLLGTYKILWMLTIANHAAQNAVPKVKQTRCVMVCVLCCAVLTFIFYRVDAAVIQIALSLAAAAFMLIKSGRYCHA